MKPPSLPYTATWLLPSRNTLFLWAVFFFPSAQIGRATPIQLLDTGHWYEVVTIGGPYSIYESPTGPLSWDEAQDAANASVFNVMRGHLATITSASENTFILGLLSGKTGLYWLGGQQSPDASEPGEGWGWDTGESWGYTNWNAGEPNDAGGTENNLAIYATWDHPAGSWNDATGNSDMHGMVIEWDQYSASPVPEHANSLQLGLIWFALFCAASLKKRPVRRGQQRMASS